MLCLALPVIAQQSPRPAPADSLSLHRRAHPLGEVQVRVARSERFAVGSRRLELDSATLSQFRGGTVADALQARSPLYLKNYGPGQAATISLRGTSAQHTAVLWNGLNIMLPTLGQNDFALLPLGAGTGVAVQPGPGAALFGGGAIGGAVLLTSETDWRPGLRGSVQADAGSFGLRGGSAQASGAGGRVSARLAASYREALNNYPYTTLEFGGPVRHILTGAALHRQWSVAPEVAWRLGQAGQLRATAWLTETDRDIQPAVGTTNRRAREFDRSQRYALSYQHQASTRVQWLVRGAWFEDVLNYRDVSLTSNSRVRTTQGQAEATVTIGQRSSLRLGIEAQHFVANLNEYGRAEVAENRGAAFALFRYDARPHLRLTANLRQAILPQAAPLTPTLGLEWDLLKTSADSLNAPLTPSPHHLITLKASAARSYRAPTLNERYWQVGGNPNLRPETGLGYEAGLRHRLEISSRLRLETELTAYQQLVDDWVQWTPGSDNLWRPRNLRQVLTQGLEASSTATWQRARHRLSARLAYAYTLARTHRATAADPVPAGLPLPYVPPHTVAGSLDYSWRGWRASATGTFTSYRFTDAGGVSFLPGYGLLGGSLGYVLPLPGRVEALLLAQGTNLLSTVYESYEGRPAPPRAVLLSLRLNWR